MKSINNTKFTKRVIFCFAAFCLSLFSLYGAGFDTENSNLEASQIADTAAVSNGASASNKFLNGDFDSDLVKTNIQKTLNEDFKSGYIYSASGTADSHSSGGDSHSEDGHADHNGPIVEVLLQLAIVLLAAKIGGDIAIRLGQPEVLGELVMGVVLGSASIIGITFFDSLKTSEYITILSELGVTLLLFEVGLETNIKEMKSVGVSSLIVALLGVVAPFFLGWGVAAFFVPDANTLVHLFVGATLTATSVGITARVLKDLGKIQAKESKIILGAAVIDDVLGLLTLAVVSGIITSVDQGREFETMSLVMIILKAVGFLGGALFLGQYFSPAMMKAATYLKSHGMLLATSLIICFGLSYLAALSGLAFIVGAFTAGLILDEVHYEDLVKHEKDLTIEHLIAPISSLLVPIFFVVMGARVDISVFGDTSVLLFAFALTIAAIIGKQICSLGVREKDVDGVAVGFGMIPRGEVGLIFVGIGSALTLKGEPVVDDATFGAVVIMVIITTMAAPPLIKWRFK